MSRATPWEVLEFRRRASTVGKQAMQTADLEQMLKLLQQALSWIQLAENEEALVQTNSEHIHN
jgi:hypothetical protein